jgi:hypothetical protein
MISREALGKLYGMKARMKMERSRFDMRWRQIAAYINPSTADWNDLPPQSSSHVLEDLSQVHDTTAIEDSNTLADGVEGYAFSREDPWFKLEFLDDEFNQAKDSSSWLRDVEKHLYKQIARSNWYDEARIYVKGGADYATSVMIRKSDYREGTQTYLKLHLKRCYLDWDKNFNIDVLFYDFYMSKSQAIDAFGEENMPDEILQDTDEENGRQWKFTQFIFPPDRYPSIQVSSAPGMTYYSCVASQDYHSTPIEEGFFEVKPFFVWRWNRSEAGEIWGVDSPGIMMLPNVLQANSTRKDLSRVSQKMARPSIAASESLYARIDETPNGKTWLRPGEQVVKIDDTGSPEGLQWDLDDLRKAIHKAYHTDFFLMLTQLAERDKTATEVNGLQGEKAAMLSAFFGRISNDFLGPFLEDFFQCERKAGRLPPPPKGLPAKEIKVKYVSPLAQLQQRFHSLNGLREAAATILQLAPVIPNIVDNWDWDQYTEEVSTAYNVDGKVARSEADIAKIRQARAKQQQQVQQMQMQQAQAQTAAAAASAHQGMSTAPEPGSPAAQAQKVNQ